MALDNQLSGSKIAKNTLILYGRMLLLLFIGLYTSRVILKVLGEEDFGIYNVVAGVVSMFTILTQSLSTAISRFLTFELGKNNTQKLKNIFSTALCVQLVLVVGVIIIAEPIAVWFLNTHLHIPFERLSAANWVLQCVMGIFAINLLSVPFNAAIIAHERMKTFAYISLTEGILKLVISILLAYSSFDKLKTYAVLMLCIDLCVKMMYVIYCKKHFFECKKFSLKYTPPLLKEIGSFAGWNFIGNGVWVLNNQGINILTNIFFGVKVNTARGIAVQVNNAVQQFVNNFTTALNPQITKSYAMGEYSFMRTLMYRGAKYSYFLMFFFALPLCLETEQVLNIWLHKVPEYAVIFVRLTLIGAFCTVVADSMVRVLYATGKIKKYQIVVGSIGLLDFPLTYLVFKMGCPPWSAYIIYIFIYFVLIFVRLFLIDKLVSVSPKEYIKQVLVKISYVSLLAAIVPFLFRYFMPQSLLRLLLVVLISSGSILLFVYFLGIDKSEKQFFISKIRTLLHK
ncbi:MAG: MATE family efflux transporter [Bacteroidota bacterium]|nr:MATE family efflux transporter [Bacteroidota bacterium]